MRPTSLGIIGLGGALLLGLPPAARAEPTYLTAWRQRYPTSTLDERMNTLTGSACNVCHHPTRRTDAGNCYRADIAARLHAGRTIQQALADVETMDSDHDGATNLAEILAPRPDGGIGYSPGLTGATGIDPCGAESIAITNQPETPPRPCRPDFNNSGTLDVQDIFDFLAAWFGGDPRCNFNGVGALDVQDVFDFLTSWFTGC